MIKVKSADIVQNESLLYVESPSYSGILSGESAGDIWVDDKDNPTIALVYSSAVGGFSVMGEPKDKKTYKKLYTFFKNELKRELKSKAYDYFEFSVESEYAEENVLKVFFEEGLSQEDEYYYLTATATEQKEVDGYDIVEINPTFIHELEQGKYNNADFLKERLIASWGTYEQFFLRSIAYVALYKDTIAGVIIGTARFKKVLPIDIEVSEDHRRKGLAASLTEQFVNQCVRRGLVAQWNCVDSNKASQNTAEKTGFKLIKKKPYYWFKI